jgi:hexosaminidase
MPPFKILLTTLCLVVITAVASAQAKQQGIIPQPVKFEKGRGVFVFSPATGIAVGDNIAVSNLTFFNQYIKSVTGYVLPVNNKMIIPSVNLDIDSTAISQKEAYSLVVTPKKIKITGHDEAGVFYGLQSLIQLLGSSNGKITVESCTIQDIRVLRTGVCCLM